MFWAFLGVAAFPLVMGFINPRFYEFERDLKFSREFITTVLNRVAGVTVSISVAVIFRTYWAIILGMLTGGAVQLALSYLLRPVCAAVFLFDHIKRYSAFQAGSRGVSFMGGAQQQT